MLKVAKKASVLRRRKSKLKLDPSQQGDPNRRPSNDDDPNFDQDESKSGKGSQKEGQRQEPL